MSLISNVYSFWEGWFKQPPSVKEGLKHGLHGSGGWYPPYSEGPGLEGGRDPKEYFHYRASHFGLDSATDDLFRASFQLALNHLEISKSKNPDLYFPLENHVLRIIRYFTTPVNELIVGETHKDFNLCTIAWQATQPGLQIIDDDGKPQFINPNPFLALNGEILDKWSQGIFPAQRHRVVVIGKTERYAAVFFYLPDKDFIISPGYTARDYWNEVLPKAGTLKEDI